MTQYAGTLSELMMSNESGVSHLVLAGMFTHSNGLQSKVWLERKAVERLLAVLEEHGDAEPTAPDGSEVVNRHSDNLSRYFEHHPEIQGEARLAISACVSFVQRHAQAGRPVYRGAATLIRGESSLRLVDFDVQGIQAQP